MIDKNIELNKSCILVTGAAGFIGCHLVLELISSLQEATIIGLDNLNDYYDVSLKHHRLSLIQDAVDRKGGSIKWEFAKGGLQDMQLLKGLFEKHHFQVVVNLAAQAGVRYSIENPQTYIESNLIGFCNILECCRHYPVRHLVYASSSSVYGMNEKIPYSTEDMTDRPVSLYAATKKSNELLAHSYSKLYGIPCTGLRFFTVYGPAGRPDMAYFSFTNKLIKGKTIQVFNFGNCRRDFTYVDDIVQALEKVMERAPIAVQRPDGQVLPPAKVYNIGGSHPENLMDFVRILSEELISAGVLDKDYDLKAHMELVPMQPGDVVETYADVSALEEDFGIRPKIGLREGLGRFAKWYKTFYLSDLGKSVI